MPKTEGQSKPMTEPGGHACGLRRCEQCGYGVSDPMVARCPRCWGPLPAMKCGGCTGCSLFQAGGFR